METTRVSLSLVMVCLQAFCGKKLEEVAVSFWQNCGFPLCKKLTNHDFPYILKIFLLFLRMLLRKDEYIDSCDWDVIVVGSFFACDGACLWLWTEYPLDSWFILPCSYSLVFHANSFNSIYIFQAACKSYLGSTPVQMLGVFVAGCLLTGLVFWMKSSKWRYHLTILDNHFHWRYYWIDKSMTKSRHFIRTDTLHEAFTFGRAF